MSHTRAPGRRVYRVAVATLLALVFALCPQARAGQGDCAQPSSVGSAPTATDCLFILNAAVGNTSCTPECICAPKGTLPTTATDALICLNRAVGGAVELNCPCNGGSTTSTTLGFPTTTTTTTTSTTLGEGYSAQHSSYINTLTFPPVDLQAEVYDPECCHDFGPISRDFIENGTNLKDNGVAVLAAALAAITGTDLNAVVAGAIATGEIVHLLDHRGIATTQAEAVGIAGGEPFILHWLQGRFAPGTDFAAANSGTGEFLIQPSSFEPGTTVPRERFTDAAFGPTTMIANGDTFGVAVPFGGLLIQLPIELVRVTGTHAGATEDGVTYSDGAVSGVVRVDDMFAAVNGFLRGPQCTCLGIATDVFTKDIDGVWVGTGCIESAIECISSDERLCVLMAEEFDLDDELAMGACDVIPTVTGNIADIDLDGDTATFEGLSSGERFTAVTATISGVADE